jgi:hypothetical protein
VGGLFVTKLSASGGLVYSTFFGDSTGGDEAHAIAVDATGAAYVAGAANASDFPTTPGALQPAGQNAFGSAFVTKIGPAGDALAYSTLLGGGTADSFDAVYAVAVDPGGNAYVAGATRPFAIPTTAGAFQTAPSPLAGAHLDAFVTKLNPNGTALVYSSYLGGNRDDQANGIAVDAAGNAYVAGYTKSSDFPTTPGAYVTSWPHPDSTTSFVSKVSADGSSLLYSTYLGQGGLVLNGIAVNGGGNAFVTGYTFGSCPTTAGAFQTTASGGVDVCVTKLNGAGTALVYSTYLAGTSTDEGNAIAVDAGGSAYVVGYTVASSNFPLTPDALAVSLNPGGLAAFFSKLNPAGNALVYSTLVGPAVAYGVAVDGAGSALIAGAVSSGTFPTTPGAAQPTLAGASDAFALKITASPSASVPAVGALPRFALGLLLACAGWLLARPRRA